jgi:hypothetical protein
MHKVMTVIKMRGSAHSKDLRLYDVTANGVEIGNTLYEYRGIITGVAQRHLADESETARQDQGQSLIVRPGERAAVPGHKQVGDSAPTS